MEKYIVIEKGDRGENRGPIWEKQAFKTWETREEANKWAHINLTYFTVMKIIVKEGWDVFTASC